MAARRQPGAPQATATRRLRVDPVACEAVGMCARVAAALVELDRWGYPIVGPELADGDLAAAQRAVRACPRRALWVEDVPAPLGGRSA